MRKLLLIAFVMILGISSCEMTDNSKEMDEAMSVNDTHPYNEPPEDNARPGSDD
jgi:hypothetical protein